MFPNSSGTASKSYQIQNMTVAIVQFSPWDKIYYFELAGFKVKKGDRVIVRTDLGLEYAEVLGVKDFGPEEIVTAEGEAKEFKPIVRMATKDDAERVGRIREKADGMNLGPSSSMGEINMSAEKSAFAGNAQRTKNGTNR